MNYNTKLDFAEQGEVCAICEEELNKGHHVVRALRTKIIMCKECSIDATKIDAKLYSKKKGGEI